MSRININEIDNTITNYSTANLDNVVALVGNTTDGPYNTWKLITTYADFINTYGQNPESNNLIGNSWDYAVNLLLAKIPILFKRICPFSDMSAHAVDSLYFRGNNIIEIQKNSISGISNEDASTVEGHYTAKVLVSLDKLLYTIDEDELKLNSKTYDKRAKPELSVKVKSINSSTDSSGKVVYKIGDEVPDSEQTYAYIKAKYPGTNANNFCVLPYVNIASRVLYFNTAMKIVSGNTVSYNILETIKIGSSSDLVVTIGDNKAVNVKKAIEIIKNYAEQAMSESAYVIFDLIDQPYETMKASYSTIGVEISDVKYKIVNNKGSKCYQSLVGGRNFLDYTTDNGANYEVLNPDGSNDNDTAEYLQQYLPYITKDFFENTVDEDTRKELSKVYCYGKNGVVEYKSDSESLADNSDWNKNWMVLHVESCTEDKDVSDNTVVNKDCLVMFADPSKHNVWYTVAQGDVYSDLKDKYKYHFDFVSSSGYTDPPGEGDICYSLISLADDKYESEDGTFGRGDIVALIDPAIECGQEEVLSYFDADSINTSYAAAYAPWSKIMLPYQNQVKYMPPSYIFLYTYAKALYNGSNKWAAPAGVTRASVPEIYNSIFEVGSEVLAEWQTNNPISINPIININRYGYTIFGQKTLYNKVDATGTSKSALQELAVRMTANDIKKAIFYTSLELTFEYNNIYTWNEFKTRMAVTLDAMKNAGAIVGYQMVLDDTTTTAQDIAENRIKGNIKVAMTRSVEDFDIDFEIMPSTVTFEE